VLIAKVMFLIVFDRRHPVFWLLIL